MYSASKLIPVFVPLFLFNPCFPDFVQPPVGLFSSSSLPSPALGAWHCALALQISQNAQIGRTVGILGVVVEPTPAGLRCRPGGSLDDVEKKQLFMVMLQEGLFSGVCWGMFCIVLSSRSYTELGHVISLWQMMADVWWLKRHKDVSHISMLRAEQNIFEALFSWRPTQE